ncbi:MAG TPA: (4Fe-4S)-binding protein, partial [Thermoanaerobaculia bacterium]
MRKTYADEQIAVSYDARLCIHAKRCVHGAPEAFDPQGRPWIQPANASADKLAAVIAECPTGALRYERLDGGPAEPAPAQIAITFEKDGPIYVRGPMPLLDAAGHR